MIQENQHLQPGTVFAGGKYRIVRFIGAGGFGCTYEAEFVPMSSRVAIKEFFVSSCCNRDASGAVSVGIASQSALVGRLEDKFRAEAKRLFNLKHPGIVSVTDILDENGTSYYVMDYIDGRSLQSVIDHEGPLPEARALRYIRQVMDALEYVHGKSMLHLDIKPDNIMIDAETDRAILIDFGVSKQYDEVDGHNTSTIMGQTPGYAPPEQAGNSIRQFTPAADIYALGATLYTALTGCVPPSSPDLISGLAHLEPLPAGTSAATQAAIGRMMQPTVTQRPQSVAAARAMLAGMENGELKMEKGFSTPTAPFTEAAVPPAKSGASRGFAPANVGMHHGASSSGTLPVVAPAPKPKKWLWAAIAAAAIIIAGIVAIFLTRGSSSPAEENIAVVDSVASDDYFDNSDNSDSAGQEEVVATQSQQSQAEKPQPQAPQMEQPQHQAVAPTPVQAEPAAPANQAGGTVNGHEWLDMGTSVKWATTNVGSTTPKGNGSYFAWGETSPKSEYTEANSRTYGKDMNSIAGNSSYDAARANWGSTWRLPTKAEFQELIDKCTWTWYGKGYVVKAKNGNVLYLPAAGYRYGTSLYDGGEYGSYWSATPDIDSRWAWNLYFNSGDKRVNYYYRSYGRSVRPVLE